MKKMMLVVLLLACMVGSANAAYWQVSASTDGPGVSSFSVVFNDADDDDTVTLDDVVSFSGVYLTTSGGTRFYDSIYKLSKMKIDEFQLLSSDTGHWTFYTKSFGYPVFNDRNWTYSANLTSAPTPIPGAMWLLGTGIAGLIGLRRRFR